jgi:FkbM family methyltransferase
VIGRLKRALRDALETRGYVVRASSLFGVSLMADLRRLMPTCARPLIIDVGANTGQWLIAIKNAFPNAHVLCYEPDPRAFVSLQNAASSLPSVECMPCALGREAGGARLFRNAESVTSSLLPAAVEEPLPYADKLQPLDAIEIEVRTLARELGARSLGRVNLLKTDCQGFDLQVLEGAAREIERGDVDLIVTEAMFQQEYENQGWFEQTLPWLRERDYALIGLYDALHDSRGRMLFADALFARAQPATRFAVPVAAV